MAFNLSSGPDHVKNAAAGYKDAVREAKLADAIEGSPEVLQSSEWLDSRSAGTRGPFREGPILQ
ncbi:MAG: hypothetical protein GWO22_13315, partial [Actinobacteria bacterium]|nr:hypothetical protein [Actinomycetota bacterium]